MERTKIAEEIFNDLHKQNHENLLELEKYKRVNEILKRNNWLLLSPLFFQGYEIDYFLDLNNANKLSKNLILNQITTKFYNLNWTATFVDGYCSQCKYIEPFTLSIESSIILAFQKDYEGGLKTILPIIEGIIRKYLIAERKYSNEIIHMTDIKKSIKYLCDDILSAKKTVLLNLTDNFDNKNLFYNDQINQLMEFNKNYYNTWLSFISDFFDNSLYLSTKNEMTTELNRHAILHELGYNFDYTFENFLKVYFVIQFLSWIFQQKDNQVLPNNIDSDLFINKVISYKNIIKISERIDFEKHVLLKGKKGYQNETLRVKFNPTIDLNLKRRHWLFLEITRWMKERRWRVNKSSYLS